MLLLDLYLFGFLVGPLVWSGMAIWTPIMGNIINGIGHALGYRNFATRDESRNLYPWGIWILGEELHNNHHADPRSAKFKARWWEFDVGWVYIKLLSFFDLAKVVYARTAGFKEFAGRHYNERVARPVAGQIDRASVGFERAKAGARAKVDEAKAGAKAKVDDAKVGARARVEGAKARVEGAKERVDQAQAEAKAALKKPHPAPE
jgi:hypothetical protein